MNCHVTGALRRRVKSNRAAWRVPDAGCSFHRNRDQERAVLRNRSSFRRSTRCSGRDRARARIPIGNQS